MEDSNKKKIALIEDDEDQANIFGLHLAQAGYDVTTFPDVTESTDYFIKGKFDLTLLDLRLTKHDAITGERFWRIIKQHKFETPVIIVSGESEERIQQAEEETGAICYFRKPYNVEDVILKINSVLK